MGVRDLFRRRPTDDELREEVETHLAMRAEHDSSDDAGARRRLGGRPSYTGGDEACMAAGVLGKLQDARFKKRMWCRNPAFSVAALATLALGLGAATALFSVCDRILFRSLPYSDPERLVSVGLVAPLDANEFLLGGDYVRFWRETPPPFEVAATVTAGTLECDLTEAPPQRLSCASVEANLVKALGLSVPQVATFVLTMTSQDRRESL